MCRIPEIDRRLCEGVHSPADRLAIVGVVNDPLGKPLVIFSERGLAKCRELGIGAAHVSLTDEAGLVVAMAVMEREA